MLILPHGNLDDILRTEKVGAFHDNRQWLTAAWEGSGESMSAR
jgi:hypothetical protein